MSVRLRAAHALSVMYAHHVTSESHDAHIYARVVLPTNANFLETGTLYKGSRMQRTGIIQAERFGVAKTLPQGLGTPFSLLGPLGHCPARTAVTVELCCMQMRWAGHGSSCCTMAPCLSASCRKHILYECKGDCTLTDYYLEELKAGSCPQHAQVCHKWQAHPHRQGQWCTQVKGTEAELDED